MWHPVGENDKTSLMWYPSNVRPESNHVEVWTNPQEDTFYKMTSGRSRASNSRKDLGAAPRQGGERAMASRYNSWSQRRSFCHREHHWGLAQAVRGVWGKGVSGFLLLFCKSETVSKFKKKKILKKLEYLLHSLLPHPLAGYRGPARVWGPRPSDKSCRREGVQVP